MLISCFVSKTVKCSLDTIQYTQIFHADKICNYWNLLVPNITIDICKLWNPNFVHISSAFRFPVVYKRKSDVVLTLGGATLNCCWNCAIFFVRMSNCPIIRHIQKYKSLASLIKSVFWQAFNPVKVKIMSVKKSLPQIIPSSNYLPITPKKAANAQIDIRKYIFYKGVPKLILFV